MPQGYKSLSRIHFSHVYSKMPSAIRKGNEHITYLLAVDVNDISRLPVELLDWDTEYMTDRGLAHYILPEGKVIILVLFTIPQNHLWTTIRSWNPQKEIFYRNLIGKEIKIEVKD
jgi:hypothetical protein